MLSRVRIAVGAVLAVFLFTSTNALAKGGFDFITITGPDLNEPLQVSDTKLTEDFFSFASFYEDKTKAPADPGQGYEITRHYEQGVSDVIFDRLHYYPDTGYVFYDGIENGESEYDGEWYTANPNIKLVFESALAVQAGAAAPLEKKHPVSSASEAQPLEPIRQPNPAASTLPSSLITVLVLTVWFAALLLFAFWRRKPSGQQ